MKNNQDSQFLLIDSHSICHRAKHAMKGLSYKEMQTGVIFGFLNSVLELAEKFNTMQLIFAWDSKKSLRLEMYSGYKATKSVDKTDDEVVLERLSRPQFTEIRDEILPELGFVNSFLQPGYEADDIIADLVVNVSSPCTVVSRDNDLYQLLDHCNMYDIQAKSSVTKQGFKKTYGIEPSEWATVKSIAGCNTDTVEGIRGVGVITACKYLRGELKENTKAYQEIQSEEGQRIIERNRKLVTLPLKGVERFTIQRQLPLKWDRFFEMCVKYGFKSFVISKSDKWKTSFGMDQ